MRNIHIHVLAKTDIQQLWRSSFQQWGEAQTQVYLDQLEQAILTLQENPHIGIACDEIRVIIRGQTRINDTLSEGQRFRSFKSSLTPNSELQGASLAEGAVAPSGGRGLNR